MPSSWLDRLSRRAALGAAGATAAAIVTSPLARAQQATPAPDARRVFTMFVQTAHAGTFLPKPGQPDVYELTLEGATAQTIYFSDRPDRIVGSVPTETFLEVLGFTPANPPNAAIVAETDAGEDILVVELFNPTWDRETQTLTYDVRVLQGYEGDGLGHLAEIQADTEIAESFSHASLFIDDCPDITTCYGSWGRTEVGPFPGGAHGQCWSWWPVGCYACDGRDEQDFRDICNATYPECNGECTIATGPVRQRR